MIYTEGVSKRGMSLERFVAVTSTNAAKILGLYQRKGAIAAGSDADIVVFDPSLRKTLHAADLHGSDYSAWEGWEVHGWPEVVLLRGAVVVERASSSGRRAAARASRGSWRRPSRTAPPCDDTRIVGLGRLWTRTASPTKAREHLTIATTMHREMDTRFFLEKAEGSTRPGGV